MSAVPRSTMESLDDLKVWWDADSKKPYWSLYRGLRWDKNAVLARNHDIDDPDESFKLLEQMIDVNSRGGGDFIIARAEKPASNWVVKGYLCIQDTNFAYRNPGIAGYPAMMGALPPGKTVDDIVAERVNSEREKWELSKKVDDLEAAINGAQEGTGLERLINRLLDHPKIDGIMDVVLTHVFTPKGAAQPTKVAVSGVPGEEEHIYDDERIVHALERIRPHFPDVETFIEKLAAWVESNPDMARNLFKQI